MNGLLTIGQLNEQAVQREKALKAAASCTPKKAIYIQPTESYWRKTLKRKS